MTPGDSADSAPPAPPPEATSPARGAAAAWPVLAVVAAYAAVIASITPFVTKDGPSHLYNALILADWGSPAGAVFRRWFVVQPALEPAWMAHFLLQHLLAILPPLGAEKLVVLLSAACIPLAAVYACGAFGRPRLGALAAPFAGSFAFHMGFFSFTIGTALALVVVGYWFRIHERPTWPRAALLALLALLLLWAHPIPFACALAVLSGSVLGDVAARDLRRLGPLVLAWLPALGAFGLWWAGQPTHTAGPVARLGPIGRVAELLCMVPLWGYGWASAVLATGFAFLVWALVYRALRRHARDGATPGARGLGVGVLVLTAAALVAPDGLAGGSILILRLILTVPPFAIMWLAARPLAPTFEARAGLAGAAVALLLLGVQIPAYLQISQAAREGTALGRRIPPGSTLVGRSTSFEPSGTLLPFLPLDHVAAYVATERHLALLDDYEAIARIFPVRFRTPDAWARSARGAQYSIVIGAGCPRELAEFEVARSAGGRAVLCEKPTLEPR